MVQPAAQIYTSPQGQSGAPQGKKRKRGWIAVTALIVIVLALVTTGVIVKVTGSRTRVETLDQSLLGSNLLPFVTPKEPYLSNLSGDEPVELMDICAGPNPGEREDPETCEEKPILVDSKKPYFLIHGDLNLSERSLFKVENTQAVEVPLPASAPPSTIIDLNDGIAILRNEKHEGGNRFWLWDVEADTITPYPAPENTSRLWVIGRDLYVAEVSDTTDSDESENRELTYVGLDRTGKHLWENSCPSCSVNYNIYYPSHFGDYLFVDGYDYFKFADGANRILNATNGAKYPSDAYFPAFFPGGVFGRDRVTDEVVIHDAEFKIVERFHVSASRIIDFLGTKQLSPSKLLKKQFEI